VLRVLGPHRAAPARRTSRRPGCLKHQQALLTDPQPARVEAATHELDVDALLVAVQLAPEPVGKASLKEALEVVALSSVAGPKWVSGLSCSSPASRATADCAKGGHDAIGL